MGHVFHETVGETDAPIHRRLSEEFPIPNGGGEGPTYRSAFSLFSHCWLATPQLVLQADWQEVWHSPQPPCFALAHRSRVSMVLILSIIRFSNLVEMDFCHIGLEK